MEGNDEAKYIIELKVSDLDNQTADRIHEDLKNYFQDSRPYLLKKRIQRASARKPKPIELEPEELLKILEDSLIPSSIMFSNVKFDVNLQNAEMEKLTATELKAKGVTFNEKLLITNNSSIIFHILSGGQSIL